MRINNIVAGSCSRMVFHRYIKEPEKLAWILTPVQSYQMGVQDLMETCLYKMRQALERLNMDSAKDLSAVMRIYEAFDKRVNGDYKQTINKSEKKEIKFSSSTEFLTKDKIENEMKNLGINNNDVVIYDENEK